MHPIRNTCLVLALLASGSACAADLTVRIDKVKSARGTIQIAVYDAGSFLKRAVKTAKVAAAEGSVSVVIKDLPEGSYGLALYRDANDNGKMDSNFMGIPVEDYAFSNNAFGKMGPPSFEQVKFAVPGAGATTIISLP